MKVIEPILTCNFQKFSTSEKNDTSETQEIKNGQNVNQFNEFLTNNFQKFLTPGKKDWSETLKDQKQTEFLNFTTKPVQLAVCTPGIYLCV